MRNTEATPASGVARVLPRKDAGFSLAEVLIAIGMLGLITLSSMALTVVNFKLERSNRNVALATSLTQTVLEEMQSYPFQEVFARFNLDPADDPGGAGTAPGSSFVVNQSLSPLSASPASMPIAMQVQVQFPVDLAGLLSETATLAPLGYQQWDLNGDGTIGSGDQSTSYKVLPLNIEITWDDSTGPGSFSTPLILVNEE